MCDLCKGIGYITVTLSVFYDGGWMPEYTDMPCNCNEPATDEDWLLAFDYPEFPVPYVDYDPEPMSGYRVA